MQQYEKIFKAQSVWKSIFSMAVPSLITILVMLFYNMADTFFIGQLGSTAMVAAVSIVSPVFGLMQGLGTMIGAGGSTLIAGAIGAKDTGRVKKYSSLCFWGSLILGLAAAIAVFASRTGILTLIGTNADMWDYSMQYMTVLCAGIPLMLLSTGFGSVIRAEGAVTQGLIGNLSGTITNIILDPIFILGFHWGVIGAAAATVIGNGIAVIYYMAYVIRKSEFMTINPKYAAQSPVLMLSILALGLPNAVSTLLSGLASTFSNRLLSGYGTRAIAAMSAASKSSMLVSMIMIGIIMGCQPLMAFNYGANDKTRMKELLRDLTILTLGLGAAFAVVCIIFRAPLVGLFLKEQAAADLAEGLVIYLVAAAPLLGIYTMSTNFLQAAHKAVSAIIMSVLRQGAVLIPLLYIMNDFFGFIGIALAHTLADILASMIALVFLMREYHRFMGSESRTSGNNKMDNSAEAGQSHIRRAAAEEQ